MAEVKIPEQFRPLAERLEQQGWSVEATANNHLRWVAPSGAVVVSSSTPSDHRAKQRLTTELRRAGAVIDGRGATREDEEEERPGGPAPAAAPSPPPPAEPAPGISELRELVTEARTLLAALKAERKEIARLLDESAHNLVVAEVYRQLDQTDLPGVVHALHDANQAQLDDFSGMCARALKAFNQRIAEANQVLTDLQSVREVWWDRLSGGGRPNYAAIPPAFIRAAER